MHSSKCTCQLGTPVNAHSNFWLGGWRFEITKLILKGHSDLTCTDSTSVQKDEKIKASYRVTSPQKNTNFLLHCTPFIFLQVLSNKNVLRSTLRLQMIPQKQESNLRDEIDDGLTTKFFTRIAILMRLRPRSVLQDWISLRQQKIRTRDMTGYTSHIWFFPVECMKLKKVQD